MRKIFVKFAIVGLLATTVMTQTGCVVGLITGHIPLAVIGGAVGLVGFGDVVHYDGEVWALAVLLSGIVLDEQNPGRQDALNALPVDEAVAQELKTDIQGLENYNDELLNVLETNRFIEDNVRDFAKHTLTENDLSTAARELGFEDKDKLVQTLRGDTLSEKDVASFAQARNLSLETSKIYLRTRFSIKISASNANR